MNLKRKIDIELCLRNAVDLDLLVKLINQTDKSLLTVSQRFMNFPLFIHNKQLICPVYLPIIT